MKILVTGSAGFIGSHLVDFLLTQNHQVFGVDDLSGGFRQNVNPKSIFYQLDLRKKLESETLISSIKPQLIYHLAADATESRSLYTPIEATERNYNAYLNVLVAAIKSGVKKIVLTSSISVYGDQKPPFSESLSKRPVDVYGIAKAAMEDITHIFSQVYKYEYTIVRPHNVYGPRQNLADPYRNVIGIFINCLLSGKRFYIYGDGAQKRAFSYIDDVAPYIIKSGMLKETAGEIINIGPKDSYTVNDIASEILTYFVKNSHQIPKHLKPKYQPKRPQEVENAVCTDSKARKILGFKPKTSLAQGIKKTIAWAKTIGPQPFKYCNEIELNSNQLPIPWRKKLL